MATITYDDRSFALDGKRIWLASGTVPYYRLPAPLWRDRLLKAKRAGLNCIATRVPWNYHEPREGEWNFTGDRDIAGFIRTAGEFGLYVILRPGPFIDAGWDGGGLPGWLITKTGMTLRASGAAYTHYFDKYFAQLLTRLRDLQVPRGGNLLLLQNEHCYFRTTAPDRLAYLDFVSQLFRRSGFEVPILTCNLLSEPKPQGTIETVADAEADVRGIKALRTFQHDAPMLAIDLPAGRADCWGMPHEEQPPAELVRRAMEALGCGAQFNISPFAGGTNFDFWAARRTCTDAAYQTTSHEASAPIAEGGGLTDAYYAARVVNLLAVHMGRFFANTVMDYPGANVHDSTDALNLAGPAGRWVVITNNGRGDITQARISLANGTMLDVPLQPFGAAVIPSEMELVEGAVLDYSNCTPLGFFWDRVLLVHGPAGWEGRVSINGKEYRAAVPAEPDPCILDAGPVQIAFVNTETAMRTWPLPDRILFGPDFVGEEPEEAHAPPKGSQYVQLTVEGKLSRRKYPAPPADKTETPRLGAWNRLTACHEISSPEALAWQKLDKPRDADRLGIPYGYVWYRMEIDSPRERKHSLYLPECEDRATLFLNGERLAIWGRGEGATREPIPASFVKGANVLTVLADNLGRFCDEFDPFLGSPKGLYGHVYDAKPFKMPKLKLKPYEHFSRRIVPRALAHLVEQLERTPVHTAEIPLSLTSVTPVHVSFTGVPHHVCLLCNDRVVAFVPRPRGGESFGDVLLGSELRKGRNDLRLLLWGNADSEVLDRFRIHLLQENVTADARWTARPWTHPDTAVPAARGKDHPAWFRATFKHGGGSAPLFLTVNGAKKGQLYLNGRNVGRFWNIGPQNHYYLPGCWLDDENELLLFDELGNLPTGSRLTIRPQGPFGK